MTTIGSLFSGYGGLDLAVHMAIPDTRTVWASDVEPGPNKILAERFPDAPNLGDITTIDWDQVEPVDILVGSSPCQDLSMAGARAGMKPGTRSGLWESMTHAIDVIRPRLVVWENVRGALSAEAYSRMEPGAGHLGNRPNGLALRALGRVLGDLANLGYDASWHSVQAADVGAPHHRARVFVVAYPHGAGLRECWRSIPVRAEHAPTERDNALLPLLRTPCAAEADGGLLHPDVARDRNQTLRLSGQILSLTGDLLPTPQARDGKGVPGDGFNVASLPRTVNRLLPTPLVANNENRQSDGYGPNLGAVITSSAWGEFAPAIERWEHVLGRAAPAPTQTSRTGKPQLSPAFVEWMMGLPAGWVTHIPISRAQQLRALGNGVVPQQAAYAITEMLAWQEAAA